MHDLEMSAGHCVGCTCKNITPLEHFLRDVNYSMNDAKSQEFSSVIRHVFDGYYPLKDLTPRDFIGQRFSRHFLREVVKAFDKLWDEGFFKDGKWDTSMQAASKLAYLIQDIPLFTITRRPSMLTKQPDNKIVFILSGGCSRGEKVQVIERQNGKLEVTVEFKYFHRGQSLPVSAYDKYHVIPEEGTLFNGKVHAVARTAKGNILHFIEVEMGSFVIYFDGRAMYRYTVIEEDTNVSTIPVTSETCAYIGF